MREVSTGALSSRRQKPALFKNGLESALPLFCLHTGNDKLPRRAQSLRLCCGKYFPRPHGVRTPLASLIVRVALLPHKGEANVRSRAACRQDREWRQG